MSPLGRPKLPVSLVVYLPKFFLSKLDIAKETMGADSQNAASVRPDLSNTATYSVLSQSLHLSHLNFPFEYRF